ncbi:conserved protein of unknown function [Paraburkholderia kururiensis]|nr:MULTISPECIES: hypothetical protein [Paraburkholderia]WEY41562.1 hypothetical protein P2869_29330 [Paraburkholderia sp. SUR17]
MTQRLNYFPPPAELSGKLVELDALNVALCVTPGSFDTMFGLDKTRQE